MLLFTGLICVLSWLAGSHACLCSVCCAGASRLGLAFGSDSHELPQGGCLPRARAKERLQEAGILREGAEVASDLALTVPDGVLQHGEEAGEEDGEVGSQWACAWASVRSLVLKVVL